MTAGGSGTGRVRSLRAALPGQHGEHGCPIGQCTCPTCLGGMIPFDPVIPLLGIYLTNPEAPIRKHVCTPVLIAVLFIIAKTWK